MLLVAALVAGRAGAVIGTGDIAIIGYNASTTDGFRIAFLSSATAGDVLNFTDGGWLQTTGGFRAGEGVLQYTVPTGGLAAGTTVNWTNGQSIAGTGWNSNNPSNFAFNASGDSLIAYTGTSTAVYALQQGATWDANAISASTSAEPTSTNNGTLVSRVTTNAFGGANGYYSGAMTSGTRTLLQVATANATNWTTSGSLIAQSNWASSFTVGSSASLFWDSNATTAGTGGTGTWDATTNNMFKSAAADTAISSFRWVNSTTGNDHTAVFGGTAGTVSVAAGGVTASGLTFDVNGYTIANNFINLGGTTPTVTVTNASDSATISSVFDGTSGLTKSGAGALILTGGNIYSGPTTVSGGVLQVGSGGTGDTGTGAMSITSGTLTGTGSVKAASVTFSNGTKLQAGDVTGLGLTGIGTLSFNPTGTGAYDIPSGASVELGITPGGASDKLVFNGSAGSTLAFNGRLSVGPATLTPTAAEVFDLLDWAALVTPAFAPHFSTNNLRDGSADNGTDFDLPNISGSGFVWDISSFTSNGSIAIVVVPEPGRAAMVLAGMLVLLRNRKRHNTSSPCH